MTRLGQAQVVITRPAAQAGDLTEAIRNIGAGVIAAPMLEIVSPHDSGFSVSRAVTGLGPSDWLAVLSANGARAIAAAVPEPHECRLAAIGDATAAPLIEAGWQVALVPETATAADLRDRMLEHEGRGRCVIVQAADGRPDLADGLRTAGWDVEVVAGYSNRVPELDDEVLETARKADVVVFASPSAVERYVELVGLAPPDAACIGAVTADAARASGFSTTTASDPTVPALLDAIDRCLS